MNGLISFLMLIMAFIGTLTIIVNPSLTPVNHDGES